MRVLLCVNRDLMANLALNQLWPAFERHTFDIVVSDGVAKTAPKAPEIAAWGQAEAAFMTDELFPLLDRPDAAAGGYKSFARMARATESGALQTFPSINRDAGLVYVQAFRPDVIVSIRFGQIFKAPIIGVPRFGILNLHSGILPQYRGILATFWAMLRRDSHIGCTLHFVVDGTIDTGAVVGIHKRPVDRQRSVAWNVASLYEGGTAMIAAALSRIAAGELLPTVPQQSAESGYYSYPQQDDVAAFHAAGGELYAQQDYRELLARYGVVNDPRS